MNQDDAKFVEEMKQSYSMVKSELCVGKRLLAIIDKQSRAIEYLKSCVDVGWNRGNEKQLAEILGE
jgi:hypothetical protein